MDADARLLGAPVVDAGAALALAPPDAGARPLLAPPAAHQALAEAPRDEVGVLHEENAKQQSENLQLRRLLRAVSGNVLAPEDDRLLPPPEDEEGELL